MRGMDSNHHQRQKEEEGRNQQMMTFGMLQAASSSTPHNFMSKDSGAYDLEDLDKALSIYLDGHEQKQTLNIFPPHPMNVEPSSKEGVGLVTSSTGSSKKSSEKSIEFGNQSGDLQPPADTGKEVKAAVKRGTVSSSSKGTPSSSQQDGPKATDSKTLRRLAQNREAARKSRLRKKAYVQQLESSRIKLNQLEQELQRARAQGMLSGGGTALGEQCLHAGMGGLSTEAAMFNMEYNRWLEEHHRLLCDLRAAVQERLGENELKIFVGNCLAHHDELMNLKSIAVKADVFHLISGIWQTPAERCFLWMGDFRPSHIVKILVRHAQVEPMSRQQLVAVSSLQQSTQEAEESLTRGLDALHQSLSDTVASDELSFPSNMATYMGHMVAAVGKLSSFETFVRQADGLRQQTFHRLHQILTTTQAAHGFLAIAEYSHRLRALSSLWLARPRQE